ncbi:MAG: response regulator [Pseudomonadales bacterium]
MNQAPVRSKVEPDVVIIDDDQTHADSLVMLLGTENYRAEACYGGQLGVERVVDNPPPVLILDLDMPGLNGVGVLTALNRARLTTKTIVLTGTQDVEMVGEIVRLGAYDFLTKPANPALLIATVQRALNMSELEQENQRNVTAAEQSNQLHEFLVEASPDLVYMLDDEGKFTYLNNKLKQIFEINSETLLGARWEYLFGGQADDSRLAHHVNERRTGERGTRDFEFEYGAAKTDPFFLQCTSTGLYADPEHQQFIGTYGVIRDVTARSRAERDRLELQAQIQQASKMEAMGQLAGGIAHDFNNILASIIGYAELVQNAHSRLADDAIDNYLGEVVTAGHRARDLIAQMLTFTRTNRSEPVPVNVPEVIDNVSRMLRAAIPSTIHILTEFDEKLPDARADKIQLQQVLLNLMINARDAIAGNGIIRIKLAISQEAKECDVCGETTSAPTLQLSVADNGHGIPEDIRERIFDMYYTTRSSGASGGVDSGTGLGLWLINSLVHDHGGHIQLNTAVNFGTTFSVHLPIAETVAAPLPKEPVVALNGQLIVVDDEVSVGNFIGEILSDNGFDVLVFSDSQSALTHIQQHHESISMLITDQAMPVITGLELVQSVRKINAAIPVILITAFTGATDRAKLQALGIEGFLAKPFRIAELLSAISRHAPRPGPAA